MCNSLIVNTYVTLFAWIFDHIKNIIQNTLPLLLSKYVSLLVSKQEIDKIDFTKEDFFLRYLYTYKR